MTNQVNELTLDELRKQLRSTKKEEQVICWNCTQHTATDIHHTDNNHKNNYPSNLAPWCKRCHNDHHGISDNLTVLGLMTRQYYAVQEQRKAWANRVRAYEALRYEVPEADEVLAEIEETEKHLEKVITKLVKQEPIYQEWLQDVKGCGPKLSASFISIIGDPGRFPTISSLWAYFGLDVRDGKARRKTKGQTANWNHNGRMTCWKLGKQFVKQGDFGRVLYDKYKNYYTERDNGSLTKAHIDDRARRKVVKVFLSCLWVRWRELKGQEVTLPYAHTHLAEEHTQVITPEEWVG